MPTKGGKKVQKPYAPTPKPFTEEAIRLGKNIEARCDATIYTAMKKWKLRNPTAPDPAEASVSDSVDTSMPWRKPHRKPGDIAANSNIWRRSPIAPPARPLPDDVTEYLNPENRRLMEEATRSVPESSQYLVSEPDVQSACVTLGINSDDFDRLCQTWFDTEPQINDQTQWIGLAQEPSQQVSMPFPDHPPARPAGYSPPCNTTAWYTESTSNPNERALVNTLPSTQNLPPQPQLPNYVL
jgi:hypothetical protein